MVLQDRKDNCPEVSHLLLYLPSKVVELAMLSMSNTTKSTLVDNISKFIQLRRTHIHKLIFYCIKIHDTHTTPPNKEKKLQGTFI